MGSAADNVTPLPLAATVEALEGETLSELKEVVRQFDRAVDAVIRQDHGLAGAVIADGDAIERRCALLHARILTALACRPRPADLQMLAAVLHIARGVQGVGVQCARIANLVSAQAPRTSELAKLLELVDHAAGCAVSALWLGREAFASRNVELAHEALRADAEFRRRSRAAFCDAVELADPDDRRAGTMTAFLLISYAESVADIAVDIAEQTVTVVDGLFREIADAPPSMKGAVAASLP